jgi:5-deoxy-5-amino-3-dehydroquinate synthase
MTEAGSEFPGFNSGENFTVNGNVEYIVPVPLGDRSYDVVIGSHLLSSLPTIVDKTVPRATKAAIVTQDTIPVRVDPGIEHYVFQVPDGEQAKSMQVAEDLCRRMSQVGITRSDLVIALGGGVVTDLAGYVAAIYYRGIKYINIPTSLLAQVDAAIGGKTAIDIPEGKNLVGAFWQPSAVICDTSLLSTLPDREWLCGKGEMAKYAFIMPSVSHGQNGQHGQNAGSDFLTMPLSMQIATCVELKVALVSEDEREEQGGRRVLLNYGHTLAHALEAAGFDEANGIDLRHGEAVAIGLVFAAELAFRLGRIDRERVDEHRQVVAGLGMSYELPAGVHADDLIAFMRRDKKVSRGIVFVLDGVDGLERIEGIDESLVREVLVDAGAQG